MLHAVEFSVSKNQGKLLENMVFLEFLKLEKEVFYFKKSNECDFIVQSGSEHLPIQVCWSLTDDSAKRREFTGLNAACEFLGRKEGLILTFDEKGVEKFRNKTFEIIPIYEYFLDHK